MSTAIGKLPRSFGTHNGTFHADEVTACALLLHFGMIDRDKIVRTRDLGRLENCDFVCDVGGEYDPKKRRFDHHQVEYTGSLSSAGMVLEYLRDEKILSCDEFDYLHRTFVHGIDQIDNGLSPPEVGFATFSQVISSFIPVSYESTELAQDEGFEEALTFVLGYLERTMVKFHYITGCKETVRAVMEIMDECLLFDRPMPWLEAFFELGGEKHSAEFVIMPTGDHWKLRGIPPSYERRMEVRRPMPETWAGRLGKDLQKVSGLKGGIFCHKGRFISVWETKEDAVRALKVILAKEKSS